MTGSRVVGVMMGLRMYSFISALGCFEFTDLRSVASRDAAFNPSWLLADFLGHNASAVRWQVWAALLVYLMLRFCAFLSQWSHSFSRLFTLLRSALWQKLELRSLLRPLWDSQRRPLSGHAGNGLSARFGLNLWDSHFSYHRRNQEILKLILPTEPRFPRESYTVTPPPYPTGTPMKRFQNS